MGFLGKLDKNRKFCVQIRVFFCTDVMTKGIGGCTPSYIQEDVGNEYRVWFFVFFGEVE